MSTLSGSFYFGCWHGAGHYLHSPGGRKCWEAAVPADFPCRITALDTGFLPPGQGQKEGRASLWHGNGWTILAFWDRSVDTRSGCNSAFIFRGTHDFNAMLALAEMDYPEVCKRFKFAITAADAPPTSQPAPIP